AYCVHLLLEDWCDRRKLHAPPPPVRMRFPRRSVGLQRRMRGRFSQCSQGKRAPLAFETPESVWSPCFRRQHLSRENKKSNLPVRKYAIRFKFLGKGPSLRGNNCDGRAGSDAPAACSRD